MTASHVCIFEVRMRLNAAKVGDEQYSACTIGQTRTCDHVAIA
jgi:hypothetical protein